MRIELPVCVRCCFCFPLRYGLITWGYYKMISSLCVLVFLVISEIQLLKLSLLIESRVLIEVAVTGTILCVSFICQMVFAVVLVIGGHRKNVKLLRVYYIFNIVMLLITIALDISIAAVLKIPYSMDVEQHSLQNTKIIICTIAEIAFEAITEGYLVLIIRSELIKLQNQREYRFENRVGECTMTVVSAQPQSTKGSEIQDPEDQDMQIY